GAERGAMDSRTLFQGKTQSPAAGFPKQRLGSICHRDQLAPIRAECGERAMAFVVELGDYGLGREPGPESRGAVTSKRERTFAVRTKFGVKNAAGMIQRMADRFAGCGIPDLRSPIVAGRDYAASVSAERR